MNSDEFTQSIQPVDELRGKTKQLKLADTKLSERDAGPMDYSAPRPWRIALTVSRLSTQIVLDLHGELVLGRLFEEEPEKPHVDLSPFKGHDEGVSRRHALMLLEQEQVLVMDTDSANGTFLNGEVLNPKQVYPLRHGDRLRLGKLEIKVEMLNNPYSML